MTRLATTITIPVASAAKQENSTRSLRRKGMLNASPLPPLCRAHFDTPRFGLTFDARLRTHHEFFHACFRPSPRLIVVVVDNSRLVPLPGRFENQLRLSALRGLPMGHWGVEFPPSKTTTLIQASVAERPIALPPEN